MRRHLPLILVTIATLGIALPGQAQPSGAMNEEEIAQAIEMMRAQGVDEQAIGQYEKMMRAVAEIDAGRKQRGDGEADPTGLADAVKMLEASGADPNTLEHFEGATQGIRDLETKERAREQAEQRERFEAAAASHGTARVSAEGKTWELAVTRCDRAPGVIRVEASTHREGGDAHNLQVASHGVVTTMQFMGPGAEYDSQSAEVAFSGSRLEHTFTISRAYLDAPTERVPVEVQVSCK